LLLLQSELLLLYSYLLCCALSVLDGWALQHHLTAPTASQQQQADASQLATITQINAPQHLPAY
jgi:hypothetical protein